MSLLRFCRETDLRSVPSFQQITHRFNNTEKALIYESVNIAAI